MSLVDAQCRADKWRRRLRSVGGVASQHSVRSEMRDGAVSHAESLAWLKRLREQLVERMR